MRVLEILRLALSMRKVIASIVSAARAAKTLREYRRMIVQRAEVGDLDEAYAKISRVHRKVKRYVDQGRSR